VIAKYELIDLGQVTVNVDRSGGCEVLELNVVLGDNAKSPAPKKVLAMPAV
jgi:cell division topological specificity factor